MIFSIIVPIFNREKTIARCINSIKVQQFRDFECILVDDGSKDNSVAVCKQHIQGDNRFRILTKENGGVSSARNLGLDSAVGDWITFVDSDDYIDPEHLKTIVTAINERIDLIVCGYRTKSTDSNKHSYPAAYFIGHDNIKHFLCESEFLKHMGICERSFRRSVIENNRIRFEKKLSISEDRLFTYCILPKINGIATVSGNTYIYDISDSNSLSRRPLPSKVCRTRYEYLVPATEALMKAYNIEGDDAYILWEYIWQLFVKAIHSMYNTKKSIFNAAKHQQDYYNQYFCHKLYSQLLKSNRIVRFMMQKDNYLISSKQFLKYDWNVFVNYVLTRLHFRQ